MEIYINGDFINKLAIIEKAAFDLKDRKKIKLIDDIDELIKAKLPIYGMFPAEFDSQINIETAINSAYEDHLTSRFMSLIKEEEFRFIDELPNEPKNRKAFYLLESDKINFENYGVACIHKLEVLDDFYSQCTVPLAVLEKDYSIIEKSVPPCNSLFIIDKYIFADEKKFDNIVKYVNLFSQSNKKDKFHLSILCAPQINVAGKKSIQIIPNNFNKASEKLSEIKNLDYCIYIDQSIPIDDRLIYTSYTSGAIGHPFDDRETRFSQKFIGTTPNIKEEYNGFKDELRNWKNFLSKIPEKIGINPTKYGNYNLQNRIFDGLSNDQSN